MNTTPILRLTDVSKSFGSLSVLSGVSFDAPRGSLTAVLGPSGQGKTTLLRLIAGFERVGDGRIEIDGEVVGSSSVHVRPDRRGIGIVPQEGALFPHLDVADNIGFGLPRKSQHRIDELIDLVGLSDMGSRRPSEISGGQQQRVALARALAPSPHLVLLDEPFSALDAGLRAGIRDEVIGILRAASTTTLLVTHDQEEAMSIADHVVVLLGGMVAQQGSPTDIYERPASVEVARFIGDANLLTAHADGSSVTHVLGTQASDIAAGTATVLIRPEQLSVSSDGVPGLVERRAYYGHDGTIGVRLENGEVVSVRVSVAELAPVGARVHVIMRGQATVFAG
ncbi:MAG: ABC transporter ATP-binding protein [Actinobacteria bacterium]|nr:ABC transporter ATP-binding protein [Actinomycetota bacterium]